MTPGSCVTPPTNDFPSTYLVLPQLPYLVLRSCGRTGIRRGMVGWGGILTKIRTLAINVKNLWAMGQDPNLCKKLFIVFLKGEVERQSFGIFGRSKIELKTLIV